MAEVEGVEKDRQGIEAFGGCRCQTASEASHVRSAASSQSTNVRSLRSKAHCAGKSSKLAVSAFRCACD